MAKNLKNEKAKKYLIDGLGELNVRPVAKSLIDRVNLYDKNRKPKSESDKTEINLKKQSEL